jgi:putative transposase
LVARRKKTGNTTLETDFCLQSLNTALQHGKKPKILNTDQGIQFTSIMWIQTVEGNGIKVSMDGRSVKYFV